VTAQASFCLEQRDVDRIGQSMSRSDPRYAATDNGYAAGVHAGLRPVGSIVHTIFSVNCLLTETPQSEQASPFTGQSGLRRIDRSPADLLAQRRNNLSLGA
jgi:hypothetical protein